MSGKKFANPMDVIEKAEVQSGPGGDHMGHEGEHHIQSTHVGGDKPPGGGWASIPGGKYGGMRKRGSNGKWQYWYKTAHHAGKDAVHHDRKRGEADEKVEHHYSRDEYKEGDKHIAALAHHNDSHDGASMVWANHKDKNDASHHPAALLESYKQDQSQSSPKQRPMTAAAHNAQATHHASEAKKVSGPHRGRHQRAAAAHEDAARAVNEYRSDAVEESKMAWSASDHAQTKKAMPRTARIGSCNYHIVEHEDKKLVKAVRDLPAPIHAYSTDMVTVEDDMPGGPVRVGPNGVPVPANSGLLGRKG